jgi:hypothetical protein
MQHQVVSASYFVGVSAAYHYNANNPIQSNAYNSKQPCFLSAPVTTECFGRVHLINIWLTFLPRTLIGRATEP